MSAYHVGDAAGMVKLDAMENPYRLPDSLLEDWASILKSAEINRYPDPAAAALKTLMREALDIPADKGLLLGNGSDEIILMLAQALGGDNRSFMSLEPAFVMYRMIAAMNGLSYASIDLRQGDFSIDMDGTLARIDAVQPAVVFIANPNNPTGNIHTLDTLHDIARVCPGLLVVDEAYAPFTDMRADALLAEYEHVLIMRTVSKMGLAGLRLGYLIGSERWINELEKVRLPYNINILTQCAAEFALHNKVVFDGQAKQIRRDRQQLYEDLAAMPGVEVWPSEANFLLFRVTGRHGSDVFDALRKQHILIKNLSNGHPSLQDCLRVTVGTVDENSRFLQALTAVLAQ